MTLAGPQHKGDPGGPTLQEPAAAQRNTTTQTVQEGPAASTKCSIPADCDATVPRRTIATVACSTSTPRPSLCTCFNVHMCAHKHAHAHDRCPPVHSAPLAGLQCAHRHCTHPATPRAAPICHPHNLIIPQALRVARIQNTATNAAAQSHTRNPHQPTSNSPEERPQKPATSPDPQPRKPPYGIRIRPADTPQHARHIPLNPPRAHFRTHQTPGFGGRTAHPDTMSPHAPDNTASTDVAHEHRAKGTLAAHRLEAMHALSLSPCPAPTLPTVPMTTHTY